MCPLSDIDRQVGDPLQIVIHLERGGNAAQIHGHRLVQGQDFEALVLDPHLVQVNRVVRVDHLLSQVPVAVVQRAIGLHDQLLDAARKRE